MPADRSKWPILVQLGLWGLPSRGAAWFFFWLSMALAAASIPLAFLVHPICIIGSLMVLAALWYFMCIRWVDRNGRWD